MQNQNKPEPKGTDVPEPEYENVQAFFDEYLNDKFDNHILTCIINEYTKATGKSYMDLSFTDAYEMVDSFLIKNEKQLNIKLPVDGLRYNCDYLDIFEKYKVDINDYIMQRGYSIEDLCGICDLDPDDALNLYENNQLKIAFFCTVDLIYVIKTRLIDILNKKENQLYDTVNISDGKSDTIDAYKQTKKSKKTPSKIKKSTDVNKHNINEDSYKIIYDKDE